MYLPRQKKKSPVSDLALVSPLRQTSSRISGGASASVLIPPQKKLAKNLRPSSRARTISAA